MNSRLFTDFSLRKDAVRTKVCTAGTRHVQTHVLLVCRPRRSTHHNKLIFIDQGHQINYFYKSKVRHYTDHTLTPQGFATRD